MSSDGVPPELTVLGFQRAPACTGQTGQVCTVRVELDFFVKSTHVILLVKGYVFPGL